MPITPPIERKKKKRKTIMAHYDLIAFLLHERELLLGNGAQPHQNLGRPQTTTLCFATQFEIFLEKEPFFCWEEKKERKETLFGDAEWILMRERKNNTCWSSEYHLLPPFVKNVSVYLTLLGMGSSSLSYRFRAACTMPRLESSP